jgi:hypothetical protein
MNRLFKYVYETTIYQPGDITQRVDKLRSASVDGNNSIVIIEIRLWAKVGT